MALVEAILRREEHGYHHGIFGARLSEMFNLVLMLHAAILF